MTSVVKRVINVLQPRPHEIKSDEASSFISCSYSFFAIISCQQSPVDGNRHPPLLTVTVQDILFKFSVL